MMKFFAVLMLAFLPITTVSTVYGTQFFSVGQDTGEAEFLMHPAIKSMFAWTIPLTLSLVGFLFWKYQSSEGKFQRRQGLGRKKAKNGRARNPENGQRLV